MQTTHTRKRQSLRLFARSILRFTSLWHLLFIATLAGTAVWLIGPAGKALPPAKAAFFAIRLVAPGGADSGDCTGSPCLTINYAIGQAIAGDTVSVAAGTYVENVTLNKSLTMNGAQGALMHVGGWLRKASSHQRVRRARWSCREG
jgi:hypothetical protein